MRRSAQSKSYVAAGNMTTGSAPGTLRRGDITTMRQRASAWLKKREVHKPRPAH